jgi:hypothetical protein
MLERHRDFVDAVMLRMINAELLNSPGWIYRNNFWRYYLVSGLTTYHESRPETWYCNQSQAMASMNPVWSMVFAKIHQLAGPNFQMQRYALTGQTQAQYQTLHRDTSLALFGKFRSYLLYLNDKWDRNQGGTTDFVVEDQIVQQEFPEPGKLIVFDSQCLHVGNPPTVPNLLRLSLVVHGQLS